MRFQEINLDDFGCFQHARMDGLDDGLVVVGGPQRAGKTTFMQAIRRLGYGIDRGDDVPPPSDAYRVRTIAEHGGREYRLSVEGHSSPTFTAVDGDADLAVDDVYGLSPVQYRQLFTISLDELRRLPDGIDDEEDLAEVLLGAAYGDIGEIPDIKATFADRANDIGLTTGDPSNKTSDFYSAHQRIQDGIEERKAAREQVDTYYEKRDEYEELDAEIDRLERRKREAKLKRQRLSVVESEFERVREWQQLRDRLASGDLDAARAFPTADLGTARRLDSQYEQKRAALAEAEREFREQTTAEDPQRYERRLLDNADEIDQFARQVSGWRTTRRQLRKRSDALDDRRADLRDRIADLHPEWDGDLDAVESVETNHVTRDRLDQIATQYREADRTVSQKERERERKRSQLDEVERRLAELDPEGGDEQLDAFVRNVGLVAGSAVLVAVGASAVGFTVGGVVGAVVLLVGGLYYLAQNVDVDPGSGSEVDALESERTSLENAITGIETDIEAAKADRERAESELRSVRERYGLPDGVSPEAVEEFHESVVRLRDEVAEFRQDLATFREERDDFEATLREVAGVVSDVTALDWDDDAPLDSAPALFEAVEQLEADLDLAENVARARDEADAVETDVERLLAKVDDLTADPDGRDAVERELARFIERGERAEELLDRAERRDELESDLRRRMQQDGVQAAFDPVRDDDEDWLSLLERTVEQYVDQSAVQQAVQEVEDTVSTLEDDIEEARQRKVRLEQELSSLKSADDITAAEQQIESAREELRRHGERYAVNRIAEAMTDRLYQRFIERVADPLVDEASDIFRRVTREYEGIGHNEEFESLDFEAIRNDDARLDPDQLSRATTEQLFLSMRITRIRDIDTRLPVVVDDAMTNFDPAHQRRTLRTLAELAETNQIFFLACHPEMVDRVAETTDSAQYWTLDDGEFDGGYDAPTRVTELLTERPAVTAADD